MSHLRLLITRPPADPALAVSLHDASGPLAHGSAPVPDSDALQGLLDALACHISQPPAPQVLQAGADLLARIVFPPPVRDALLAALHTAGPEEPVYLWLDGDDPDFATLPWEFAAFPRAGGFLGLHPRLHVLRVGADAAPPVSPVAASGLRVLVAGANPASTQHGYLAHLNAEMDSVVAALTTTPECRRTVATQTLRHATPFALQTALAETRPTVLHLLAHGEMRPSGPALVLQGQRAGEEALVYGDELARYLYGAGVQCVVLSACGTPQAARELARCLLPSVPALIVTQMPWRDSTARHFARALYSTLGEGGSLPDALAQARAATQGAGVVDWGAAALWVVRDWQGLEISPDNEDSPPIPVVAAPAAPLHDVPDDERPFVGRGDAAQAIMAKLRGGAGLVTITGIGGLGKSTLARHCARFLAPDFEGGVRWVELDGLNGRDEIAAALCAALDISSGDRAPADALAAPPTPRAGALRRLVVLDCFERHLAHAPLVEQALRGRAGVSCLVTSRALLGLPREHEYALPPMTTTEAPAETPAPRRAAPAETWEESALLFAEAATHAAPDFALTPQNRPLVEALCRRLEGVPLSLVLAAGRLRYLSLSDLAAQVEAAPLRVLRRRNVGDPAFDRHAALQEVIAGSFALLPPAERNVMAQLGVFVGGFGLNDALAVCQPPDGGDVLDSLSHLRDHSLVQVLVREGDTTRYRLLDTIREYLGDGGTDQLAACQSRHAAHYARLARDLNARMARGEWAEAAAQMRGELGNLRAAIEWATANAADDLTISLADALTRLLGESGLWQDFDTLTAAALAAHERRDDAPRRMRLWAFRAQMARRRGAESEARLLLEKMRSHFEANRDMPGVADTLFELANQARDLNETDRAGALLEQAEAAAHQAGLFGTVASALVLQAELAAPHDPAAARTYLASATRRLDGVTTDPDAIIFVGVRAGCLLREWGEAEGAEAWLLRALETAALGNRTFGVSRALLELGVLYERAGNLPSATLAYLAAERVHASLDARRREETVNALARFKRTNRGAVEVQQIQRETRSLPWNELVARLLQMGR